jgi:hypothetical protein
MPSPAFAFFALATIVLDRRLTPPQQTVQVVRFRESGKEGELYRIPNEKREAARKDAAPAIGTSHKRGTHLARELLRAPRPLLRVRQRQTTHRRLVWAPYCFVCASPKLTSGRARLF